METVKYPVVIILPLLLSGLPALEAERLGDVCVSSSIVSTPVWLQRVAASSGLSGALGRMRRMREIKHWIDKSFSRGVRLALSYCDQGVNRLLSGALAEAGVTFISRSAMDVPYGAPTMPRATFHRVADHELSFAGGGGDDASRLLVRSLAIARPATRFRWFVHGRCDVTLEPEVPNLSLEVYDSLKDLLSAQPVDWYLALDDARGPMPAEVAEAAAAGLPFVAVESTDYDRWLDDESSVIFAPFPEREELVRGLLPFIESDYRHASLGEGSLRLWQRDLRIERTVERLVEMLNSSIDHR